MEVSYFAHLIRNLKIAVLCCLAYSIMFIVFIIFITIAIIIVAVDLFVVHKFTKASKLD